MLPDFEPDFDFEILSISLKLTVAASVTAGAVSLG